MSYRAFTAGNIMDIVAGLLNDYSKESYTYVAQKPFFQIALQELQEHYELNNLPTTNQTSDTIEVDAGVTEVGFEGDTPEPNLPDDLVEIRQLWYSPRDQNVWTPMTKREFLPHYLETVQLNPLTYWAWLGNPEKITFLPAIADSDIKMDYIQNLFTDVVDENSQYQLINGRTMLEFRTAGLCARFIGENATRADDLDSMAEVAKNKVTGINVKGQQVMPVRRRPFRARFKSAGRIL